MKTELQASPAPGDREPPAEAADLIPDLYPSGPDFRVVPTGTDADPGRHRAQPRPERRRLRDGRRPDRARRDRRGRPRSGRTAEAEVIDASGMIVMPGFVDSHRHIWEGLLRNIGTDVPLEGRSSYISFVLHKLAPAFRPEDAYIGDLISALGAIDAGITTLLDWSHIQGSPAHTDAVIQALQDSGHAGGVRLRVPVVGQVGGASAQLVRPGGDRALLHERSDAHAGARRAGPGVHGLRGDARSLEAGPRGGSADHDPRGRGELRTGRQAPGDGRGGSPRPRHDVHPLHHAERHRDPDDRRHGWHGVAGVAGGDDDGPRDAPDPEVPRPGPASEPERRRRDQRAERHVQPDALGAGAATGIGGRRRQVAAPSARRSWPAPRSRGPGRSGSTRRSGR